MTNLLKKIIDVIIYIKEILFTVFFIMFCFVSFLLVLYVLKSAVGINIFKDLHIGDFFSALGDFFVAIKDFFAALISLIKD